MSNPYSVLTLSNHYKEVSLKNLKSTMKTFWSASKDIYSEETYQKFMKKVEDEPEEDKKKEMIFNRLAFVKYYYLKSQKSDRADEFKKAYHTIRNETRRRLYEASKTNETNEFTKGTRTIQMLHTAQERMKKRVDPENLFHEYTGEPYRWGVLVNEIPEDKNISHLILLNDKNEKKEQVIVFDLGEFRFESNMTPPTAEYPKGRGTYSDRANILGVVKLDENNQLLRNDVVVGRLNTGDHRHNKDFFKEVYVSNERIDKANENNNGFIGSIFQQEDGRKYIEYNNNGDSDLVTALEFAKYGGFGQYTFMDIKEKYKKLLDFYIRENIQRKIKLKVMGEDAWEK